MYEAKTVAKVDVVFAFGEYSELGLIEDSMTGFTSKLQEASNHIDAQVTAVETVTGGFNMEDADAITIYNYWDQFPNPNNYVLVLDRFICNLYGRAGEQKFQGAGTNAFNQFFIEHDSWDVADFEMDFNIRLHGCGWGSGAVFHWDKIRDRGYILVCSNATGKVQVRYVDNFGRCIGGHVNPENIGELVVSNDASFELSWPSQLEIYGHNFTNVHIEMKGTKLYVSVDGQQLISYDFKNDQSRYIPSGGIGLHAGCCVAYADVALAYDKTEKRSLGEAVQDVAWRDNSIRFVVYAEDENPEYMEETDNKDYQYTITKLLNCNTYLINLGTTKNKDTLQQLLQFISNTTEEKGTFFLNTPVDQALDKSCDWIIDKVKNLEKPEDWILVDEEVYWNTLYTDQEHDLPLNFGEHDGTQAQPQDTSDIELGNSWGVSLTHLYTDEKILAEKWRYRHFNNYFDNSTGREGFHAVWLQDPITIFPKPGLYRINYKRKDNPLSTTNLTDAFDNYRYWSTDYDRK